MIIFNFDVISNLASYESRFFDDGKFVNIKNTLSFQPFSSFEKFTNEIESTLLFFTRGFDILKNTYIHTGNLFPPIFLFNVYLLFFFFLYSIKKKDFYYLKIFFFLILIITSVNIFKHFLIKPLDKLSEYQIINLLEFIYPLYFIILLIILINFFNVSKKNLTLNISLTPIIFILVLSISWLNLRSFISIKTYGGWDIYVNNQINQFFQQEDKSYFRVISLNNNPKASILSAKGISTFDGFRFNHSKEKSLFFSISLINNPNKIYSERQSFNNLNSLNFKMLAMANVKYILSEKFIKNENLILKKKIQINEKYFKKDYFIYENKYKNWGLIFVPKKITDNFLKDDEIKYYQQLKNLNFKEVFDSRKYSIGNLKILDYKYNIQNNQYEINTNSKTGYLVLNHVFKKKKLSAYCSSKLLSDTNFVNGIMTRIIIPEDCSRVIIKFN